MIVEDLIKELQKVDPRSEVYFGQGNIETLDIETVPITKLEIGFVVHESGHVVFSDTPPTGRMNVNHPSWVSSAIRII